MTAPTLSIIIVNWNVKELLALCLDTLRTYSGSTDYEVIVVDNASEDGSVQMLRQSYGWVKLIASPDNLGFTKGNNRALPEASGAYILYLNPDVELIEDALAPMLAYLEANPRVGAVGPKLLNPDRSHQNSIGRYLRLSSLLREYVLREKAETARVEHPQSPAVVEVVLGACLLVRAELVRRIGGFDERYFMYQEETDMCLSLNELGYDTVYLPTVSVIHHGSQSAKKSDDSRQRTLHENRKSQFLFIRKHYGAAAGLAARLIISLAMLVRLPFLTNKPTKARYYRATVIWLWSAQPRRSMPANR